MDLEHFDVKAAVQGNPDIAERRRLLQSLLADKFHLIVHYETKIVPIYALVVSETGKIGPQLRPHSDDAQCIGAKAAPLPARQDPLLPFCGGFRVQDNDISNSSHENGNKITMDMLAGFLSRDVDRPVLDSTGLSGFFDFDLTLDYIASTVDRLVPTNVLPEKELASFVRAVQTELGLKLESQTGPTEILVIDHVEKPAQDRGGP